MFKTIRNQSKFAIFSLQKSPKNAKFQPPVTCEILLQFLRNYFRKMVFCISRNFAKFATLSTLETLQLCLQLKRSMKPTLKKENDESICLVAYCKRYQLLYEMESNRESIFPQKRLIGTAHSQSVLGQSIKLEEEYIFNLQSLIYFENSRVTFLPIIICLTIVLGIKIRYWKMK